jgi:hypothetical protein
MKIKFTNVLTALALLLLFSVCTVQAKEVTLRWDPPENGTPTGYRLFQRTGAEFDYTKPIWEGSDTTCEVTVPDGLENAFVVRAYVKGNISGSIVESGNSNEVVTEMPPPSVPQKLRQALEKIIQGFMEIQDILLTPSNG